MNSLITLDEILVTIWIFFRGIFFWCNSITFVYCSIICLIVFSFWHNWSAICFISNPFLYKHTIFDLHDSPLPISLINPLVGTIIPFSFKIFISLFMVLKLVHNSEARSSWVRRAPWINASLQTSVILFFLTKQPYLP